MSDPKPDQKSAVMFITLVQQYQMQAWISLGKIKNPATDQLEKNLEYARLTIDMLEMLKEKTRGNLSGDESKLLDQTLSNLKLNYISAADQPDKPAGNEEQQSD